jgi:type I restriction enzyme S subunit
MGLIRFEVDFFNFASENSLRNDFKYNAFLNETGWNIFKAKTNNLVSLKEILTPFYKDFEFEDERDYLGIPTGSGYLDKFGEIISTQLITKEEHPNRLKYQIDNKCILISSLKGARTPALSFDFDLSNYVFSNGFYIFKVNENWSKKFVLYLLRTEKVKNIIDFNIYRGIGISAYKEEDLLKIQIPKISLERQLNIVAQIQPIEAEITALKNSKLNALDIINQVFGESFNISVEKIKQLDTTQKLSINFSDLSKDNGNLRSGIRWSKMQFIQQELYKNIDCIKILGHYITKTNNGWSPLSVEDGEGLPILGQESFSFDGELKIVPSKFTEETKNNINDFFINQGDFFVSRGNTVDLVALACVVEEEILEDIIYPDLYIKINFDETIINKQYLAFVFNSFFGRLYFKYVAKGKNQTMVKISAIELDNFHLPIPSIDKQVEIVSKIKTQIDAQNIIDQQIEQKQQQINEIIENAITTNH